MSGLADNKRFVSYMYEYKNDEKLNSVGYARVESRNSQCKVFIHIDAAEMEGKLLKAYMFYRKPTKNRFAYLGNLLIQNSTGELKVKTERNNIMNSNLELEDVTGIIIYNGREIFFACEWDGFSVTHALIDHIENLDLLDARGSNPRIVAQRVEKEKEDVIQLDKDQDTLHMPGDELGQSEQNVDHSVVIEVPQSKTSDDIQEKELLDDENRLMEARVNKKINGIYQEIVAKEVSATHEAETLPEERDTKDVNAVQEERIVKEKNITQEKEMADYRNRDYYKDQSVIREMPLYRNIAYSQASRLVQLRSAQIEEEGVNVSCIEPTFGELQYPVLDREELEEAPMDTNPYECHPVAQNILHRFPKVYPFEDNEIVDCVRIEPQDIGLLPIEAWVLGNNSFLLHGYYIYRHLIFGKMRVANEWRYVLGVPGVYQNRESFMARMFGFENFKCTKNTKDSMGEFGYYYIPIQFGS